MRYRLPALAATLLLAHCAPQYATISRVTPEFQAPADPSGSAGDLQRKIEAASSTAKRDPRAGLGDYLDVVRAAAGRLERNPADREARDSYNFALARVFSVIRSAKLDPWSQPMAVPTAEGDCVLEARVGTGKFWKPELYDFTPADEIEAEGLYVSEHTFKSGLGAPLVAVGKSDFADARKDFFIDRIYYGVTAIAEFRGKRCVLSFEDPLATETVRLDGHTYPLAADFTKPLAVMLASTHTQDLELSRLLRPQNYIQTARISRLQPYDPNKAVVLVIHGLKDTPATWAPMINSLRADESIRRNYQFWFYSYPSGYPYPYSAAILRRELDAVERKFPLRKPMVVMGHSMGGCISRLLITDTDRKLWMDYFGKPPEKVHLSKESREFCEEALIFKHRPEIGRVIFIAAPLKGSELASGWPGRIGSWLIKAPLTLVSVGNEAVKAMTTAGDSVTVATIPNSVDTLSPTNRFVVEINQLPITPGIPYHTIMGDRGKGGNHDKTRPVQSDGIVPYWSSHMEGAKSELVVPSGHSAHQNPDAIREVRRILLLNAGN